MNCFRPREELKGTPSPLAPFEQLERMFDHMEKTLIGIGFLDPKHPKRIMRVLRRIFGRSQLDEREVRILHGIWSQMDWYLKNKGESQGLEGWKKGSRGWKKISFLQPLTSVIV